MSAPDHFSISQAKTFSRCQMQWKLHYIDGLNAPPSAASIKGKATHEGVELIYLEKKDTGIFSPSAAVQKAVSLIDGADGIEDWKKGGRDGARDSVAMAVSKYIRDKYPDRVPQEQIEGIEEEIFWSGVSPTGQMFDMKGYADLLLSNKVIDFKTGSRKKALDAEHSLQVGFYALATQKDETELQSFTFTAKGAEIGVFCDSPARIIPNVKRIIGSIFDALQTAKRTGDFHTNGIFHTWACSFCGYGEQGLCPDYKLRSPSHE